MLLIKAAWDPGLSRKSENEFPLRFDPSKWPREEFSVAIVLRVGVVK